MVQATQKTSGGQETGSKGKGAAKRPPARPAVAGVPPRIMFWIAAATVLMLVPFLLVMALHGMNTEIRRADLERSTSYLSSQITADVDAMLDLPPGDPRFGPALTRLEPRLILEPDQMTRFQSLRAAPVQRRADILREMSDAQTRRLQDDLRRGAQASRRNTLNVTIAFCTIFAALVFAGVLAVRYTYLRTRLITRVRTEAARSEAIFDSAMDGILTLSPKGRIETINAAGKTMFGYEDEDLIGHHIAELLPPAIDDNSAFLERARRAQSRSHTQVCEMDGLRKDGSTFQVDMNLGEMTQVDGLSLFSHRQPLGVCMHSQPVQLPLDVT